MFVLWVVVDFLVVEYVESFVIYDEDVGCVVGVVFVCVV